MQSNRKTILSIIRKISPEDFFYHHLSKNEFAEIAHLCDAYWIHSGDVTRPHAELSGGLCSNAYLNFMYILQYQNISKILAYEVLRMIPMSVDLEAIDWVVGSALSATGLAKDVANILNAKWAPLEKNSKGEQVWGRLTFAPEETVLHVEDIITSGKSALLVRDAFRTAKTDKNVRIIPHIPSVASRPAHENNLHEKILSYKIQFCPVYTFSEFWMSTREKCPLCAKGSIRLRPKERDNWSALTNP